MEDRGPGPLLPHMPRGSMPPDALLGTAAGIEYTRRPRPLLTLDRWWHLALAALVALAIGVVGATGVQMYARHNAQHADYDQFKAQVIAAINQLAAQQQQAARTP